MITGVGFSFWNGGLTMLLEREGLGKLRLTPSTSAAETTFPGDLASEGCRNGSGTPLSVVREMITP